MKYATLAAVVFGVVLIYCLATEESRAVKRVIGATAVCNNGKVTTTQRGHGICSGNGGVREWVQ